MGANKSNDKSYGIEKFIGDFEKEDGGCSIIINETINSITNLDAAGLYAYLICRPPNWYLNAKQLAGHFKCNKDSIYKNLKHLININLLSCIKITDNGKFVKTLYKIHIRRFSPRLEKPDMENPDLENPDAYKTKIVKNKDIIKTYGDSKKSPDNDIDYKQDELFMCFYSVYPNKQKPRIAYKAFKKLGITQETIVLLVNDVINRTKNNWHGRDKSKIPYPSTYLNGREWEGELLTPEESRKSGYTLEDVIRI